MKHLLFVLAGISVVSLFMALSVSAENVVKPENPTTGIDFGIIDQSLLATAYSGREKFRYDVSYTGGLKLGELYHHADHLAGTGLSFFNCFH